MSSLLDYLPLSPGARGVYELLLDTPGGLLGPASTHNPSGPLEEITQARYKELLAAGLVTETPVITTSRYTVKMEA